MPGADGVEAEGPSTVQDGGELDPLVAAQARVRRPARGVLGQEVVHDVRGELLGHVPHVERDAQQVGGTPGVAGVLDRAAPARPGSVGLRVARQGQVHAGDVVTGGDRPGRGHGRVDAAGHGGQDLHLSPRRGQRPPSGR